MSVRVPPAEEIERALSAEGRGALTVRELAAVLGIEAAGRPGLRRLLRAMVADERLVALRGRRFGLRSRLGDVVGRFARHRAGFGFVTPDDATEEDVYVPVGAQGGALHGDIVAVRVLATRADGKREGRIERVVERAGSRLVGTFYPTASGGGVIEPLDRGVGFEVLVPRGKTLEARAGDLVSVELDVFPGAHTAAKGHVVERLGRPDEPGVDVAVLIRKYRLEETFPDDVERELARVKGDPADWPRAHREDFTHDLVVTIDGETAKDFDDAICVTRLPAAEGGGFRLDIHIADVAHFVPEGSATDVEALRRGTSVYFPGRAVPMLPERLSNDLCSLRPDEIRLTQGVTIFYDAAGIVRGRRFHDGFIRSRARLTYTEVAHLIDPAQRDEALRAEWTARRPELLGMLDAAAELALLLATRRYGRGAVDFDLPEPEIVLDLTGATADIVSRERNLAQRLIEEFMLAANEAVATELVRREEPTLFRVHERPDPVRVERLAEVLDGLGYTVPGTPTDIEPAHLAGLLELAKGRPEEPFVTRLTLRTMALARYEDECLGHFGLALSRYLHFTSPIRRYPDLVAHRTLRRVRAAIARAEALAAERAEPGAPAPVLRGAPPRHAWDESPGEREDRLARLPELARECSRLEREAESAEREAIAWKVASFMADRLGDEFRARIVEVAPYGILVALQDPAVEGLVHVSRLGGEYFRYDARRQTLRGAESGRIFKLGQPVDVVVEKIDALAHQVDFALVTPTVAPRGPRGGGRGSSPARAGTRGTGGTSRAKTARSVRLASRQSGSKPGRGRPKRSR